ncbi:alpha/beta hydrolase [Streptomyces sp. NBC_00829]|uniref:alpha/beta hydrolase n=1 Tax=Streptomyces sp. NBC_00829 TaxID=2903679 RepID=UPI003868BA25|nr:alpha/beta hydrolase [Streptomyces sp. NBC_00829]
MRSRRIAPFLAASVVATLVPALAPATAGAAENPMAEYLRQKPSWHRCDKDLTAAYQCATIKVPLDYNRPGGKKLDLAISRMKTMAKKERRGVLLLIPGGPGRSGLKMPDKMATTLPKAVTAKYDLVGFDPRGVGKSSPVSCGLTTEEMNWQQPYKAATFAKDVKSARTVAEKCDKKQGDKLRHITTRNTARDLDVIRAVLGEKKISSLGYSYGTYLASVYTQMFPKNVDRFVLDSSVDPARVWRGMIQVWAEGAEPAFANWTKWTAKRHAKFKLGKTPAAVSKTFWDLVAQADRKPIDDGFGALLNGDGVRLYMRGMFFDAENAAYALKDMKDLNDAAEGKKTTPAPTRESRKPERPAPPSFGPSSDPVTTPEDNQGATFWSIMCGDTRAWPTDPEQYRRDAIADKKKYPLYGDFGSSIKPCAFWKQHGAEPATKIDNKVGALILQNEWDSQTPLTSGQGLHRALKGSKMVTVIDGVGHGVVYGNKSCADKTATAYLTTGKLPAKDVTCKAAPAEAGARSGTSPLPIPTPQGIPGIVGPF